VSNDDELSRSRLAVPSAVAVAFEDPFYDRRDVDPSRRGLDRAAIDAWLDSRRSTADGVLPMSSKRLVDHGSGRRVESEICRVCSVCIVAVKAVLVHLRCKPGNRHLRPTTRRPCSNRSRAPAVCLPPLGSDFAGRVRGLAGPASGLLDRHRATNGSRPSVQASALLATFAGDRASGAFRPSLACSFPRAPRRYCPGVSSRPTSPPEARPPVRPPARPLLPAASRPARSTSRATPAGDR
jgi:hypothetical protein